MSIIALSLSDLSRISVFLFREALRIGGKEKVDLDAALKNARAKIHPRFRNELNFMIMCLSDFPIYGVEAWCAKTETSSFDYAQIPGEGLLQCPITWKEERCIDLSDTYCWIENGVLLGLDKRRLFTTEDFRKQLNQIYENVLNGYHEKTIDEPWYNPEQTYDCVGLINVYQPMTMGTVEYDYFKKNDLNYVRALAELELAKKYVHRQMMGDALLIN